MNMTLMILIYLLDKSSYRYQSLLTIEPSPLIPAVPAFTLLWLQHPNGATTTQEYEVISIFPRLGNTGLSWSLRRKPCCPLWASKLCDGQPSGTTLLTRLQLW